MTDTEWALIESFVPAANKLERLRTTTMREVVNALLSPEYNSHRS